MRNVCPHCRARFGLVGRPRPITSSQGSAWQLVTNVFRCPRCERALKQATGAQASAWVAAAAFLVTVACWYFHAQLQELLGSRFDPLYDGARVALFISLLLYAWRGATYVAHELQSDRRMREPSGPGASRPRNAPVHHPAGRMR